jgi:ketosteroid isomerase-like protein
VLELKVLGDWAWMRTRLRMTVTPPGGKPIARSGHTLTILRKQSDGASALAPDANLVS